MNSDIIFYAFRYALGRQTYAVAEVARFIVEHWSEIDPRVQRQMKSEITFAIQAKRAGHRMDVEEWEKIINL